jgi:hypothetical protein
MWEWIVGGVSVAAVIGAVVFWIRSGAESAADLSVTSGALDEERARVAAMNAVAVQERAARAKELDAKIAAVRTNADAAGLLRDVTRTRSN